MPDAADRIRVEPRASRGKAAPKAKWTRALAPRSKRAVAGAALVAMMIGIVVNAVALQHGRRIDLGPDPGPTASTPSVMPTPATPLPVRAVASAEPAAAPARIAPTKLASARPAKSSDEIAEFLRAQGADKRKLTLTAQAALAKMGFAVKATGAIDAETRSALAEFQKSRHMPVSAEITAKLVKTLTAAAN